MWLNNASESPCRDKGAPCSLPSTDWWLAKEGLALGNRKGEKKTRHRVGELAQHLRAPVALVEDLGTIPITHMVAQNCL